MSLWGTLRSVGEAFGVWDRRGDVGCTMGRIVYRETRRSAGIVNVARPKRHLRASTRAMLAELFPSVDVEAIVIRTGCRLPANRFQPTGSIYAMTFGSTIYWRDDLDESDPRDLVKLIHEVVHVEQYRRFGGESGFACAYGRGYVEGGGEVPPHIREPNAYHRNPLEAEAYRFEARFRDDHGRVDPDLLPIG